MFSIDKNNLLCTVKEQSSWSQFETILVLEKYIFVNDAFSMREPLKAAFANIVVRWRIS